MAQPLPPPPPTGATLDRWLNLLWKKTSGALQTLWSQIDTTGSNTPAGNISATTIQGAINELDTEKLAKTGDTAATLTITSADINGGTVDATTVGATTPAAGTFTTLTGSGGTITNMTLVNPTLGTPASGTVTNLTGTASISINGTVGATTPAAGTFTTLTSTGNTTLVGIEMTNGGYFRAITVPSLFSLSSTGGMYISDPNVVDVGSSTAGVNIHGAVVHVGSDDASGNTGTVSLFSGGSAAISGDVLIYAGAASGTTGKVQIAGGDGGIYCAGGAVYIDGGAGVTNGPVNVGTGYTSVINIGRAGVATHIAGDAAISGDVALSKTVTVAGTTGAQTINKTAGTVNLAAAAASLVVTNSLVTTNSIILCTVGTNDTTCNACQAVAAAGSFTIYPNAVPTAETRVNFLVVN